MVFFVYKDTCAYQTVVLGERCQWSKTLSVCQWCRHTRLSIPSIMLVSD